MPYFDITDETLAELGLNLAGSSGSVNVPTSIRWDCSIGGLPFLFGFSDQYPMRRETADFRRQRVDTERNVGEQSLDSGLWIRSQSSWHYGAGLASAEPLEVSDTEAQFRYHDGGGVDPWNPGQLSLLNETAELFASAGSSQLLIGVNTGVLHADGATVTYVTTGGTDTAVTWGGSGSVKSLATDGENYYAADTTGIYSGALPSGSGSLLWNTGATPLVRWVKSRLFAAVGVSLYELTGSGPTLPTAHFSHPNSGWVWSDFAEGPTAIYAAGYSGDTSIIYQITATADATTVTLAQPVVVADMPRGELVQTLYSYVGSYLIVGTNKGVRVASINADGSLTLGPLLFQVDGGVQDAVAVGSYVYVTVGAKGEAGDRVQRAGLYRINLGQNLNNSALQFAHAPDLVVPAGVAGAATQVTTAGDLLHFAVQGAGIFQQQSTYVAEGWIETGRVRMGTVEAKAWRSVRLLTNEQSAGTIVAHAATADISAPSGWTSVVTISTDTMDISGSLNSVISVPASSLYLAFKLTRGSSTTTPVFSGYQLQSIPAPKRTELVSVPLMLFDFEVDRQGVRYGQANGARSRYQLLKLMEGSSSTVTWRDYGTGETAEAYIERVTYNRTNPPTRQVAGNGGICTVLLRLV